MCSPGVMDREKYPVASRSLAFSTNLHSNAYYSPHIHAGLTTHLILQGQLTVSYPDDPTPSKETFGVNGRLDVDANRRHEVWMGPGGCTYVIGE